MLFAYDSWKGDKISILIHLSFLCQLPPPHPSFPQMTLKISKHPMGLLLLLHSYARLLQVKKWSGKNKILQGQGKVREFYFESGNIGILYVTADVIPLKAGRNFSAVFFPLEMEAAIFIFDILHFLSGKFDFYQIKLGKFGKLMSEATCNRVLKVLCSKSQCLLTALS